MSIQHILPLATPDPVWSGPLGHWHGGRLWRLTLVHPAEASLIVHVTRGQGRACLDGAMHGLGVNTVLCIPEHHLFSLDLTRQGAARIMAVTALSKTRLPRAPAILRLRDVDSIAGLSAILDAAGQECAGMAPMRDTALEAQAMLIAVWWQRQMLSEAHPPMATDKSHATVRRFFEQIARNEGADLALESNARALGVSAPHLSRLSKSATGMTAARILREVVLHQGLRLVTETDVPFQDIARHLGYGSAAYFTRVVQAALGQPPSSLRQKARRASNTG